MDYLICECSNNEYFILDKADYEKLKDHYWSFSKTNKKFYTHINREYISLSKFLLDIPKESKKQVLLKNKDYHDYRRSNLYTGNTYIDMGNYYIGKCFNDEEFLIDKEDFDRLSKFQWHVDGNGYVLTKIDGVSYKQHRMILNLTTSDDIEVDHINHNQLDNRKNNLRLANRCQQCMNTRKQKDNTSGVKGVYKITGYNRWAAQINANGKRYYLGSYDSLEEAVAVRREAENQLHGEYKCQE